MLSGCGDEQEPPSDQSVVPSMQTQHQPENNNKATCVRWWIVPRKKRTRPYDTSVYRGLSFSFGTGSILRCEWGLLQCTVIPEADIMFSISHSGRTTLWWRMDRGSGSSRIRSLNWDLTSFLGPCTRVIVEYVPSLIRSGAWAFSRQVRISQVIPHPHFTPSFQPSPAPNSNTLSIPIPTIPLADLHHTTTQPGTSQIRDRSNRHQTSQKKKHIYLWRGTKQLCAVTCHFTHSKYLVGSRLTAVTYLILSPSYKYKIGISPW